MVMVKHCKLRNCKAPAVDSHINPGTYGDHGMCKRHYSRLNSGFIDIDGNVLKDFQRNRLQANKCRVIDCMARPKTVGLCTWHYRDMRYPSGNPSFPAVDYDDVNEVISYQDWNAMRKPSRSVVTAIDRTMELDPDADEAPLRLLPAPEAPSLTNAQTILDLGDSEGEHPDVVMLNGIRFVPEINVWSAVVKNELDRWVAEATTPTRKRQLRDILFKFIAEAEAQQA